MQNRFRPDDKVEVAFLDKRAMQYVYQEGDDYVFTDLESFEQVILNKDWVGDLILYLKENDNCHVVQFEGKPISIELPPMVELKVMETDPNMKGATAHAQYKPALLETGLKIQVPPFIAVCEVVQVDTRTGEYLSRAAKYLCLSSNLFGVNLLGSPRFLSHALACCDTLFQAIARHVPSAHEK